MSNERSGKCDSIATVAKIDVANAVAKAMASKAIGLFVTLGPSRPKAEDFSFRLPKVNFKTFEPHQFLTINTSALQNLSGFSITKLIIDPLHQNYFKEAHINDGSTDHKIDFNTRFKHKSVNSISIELAIPPTSPIHWIPFLIEIEYTSIAKTTEYFQCDPQVGNDPFE